MEESRQLMQSWEERPGEQSSEPRRRKDFAEQQEQGEGKANSSLAPQMHVSFLGK